MIRFTPVIRKKQQLKDKTYNVKMAVSRNREVGYISTEYYVFEKEIENKGKEKGRINSLYRKSKDVDEINLTLSIMKGQLSDKVKTHADIIEHYSMTMLLAFLRDESDPADLYTIIDERVKKYEAQDNINYRDSFRNTKTLLQQKLGYKTIPVEVITYDWLTKLDYKLRELGHEPNTIGVRMRNIRTCYNEAAIRGLVKTPVNPFRQYKIPRASTEKIDLTLKEMQAIVTCRLDDPLMEWARSMYLLMFYLIGINIVDLAKIKKIKDGRINYSRSKGKKKYSIKVFPEAQAIIDRYPGKEYLVDALDRYYHYRGAAKVINTKLKDIAAICQIDKTISINTCRHSWATIGFEQGISMDLLSRGLGHIVLRESNVITKIYVHEYLGPVDEANKKIIAAANPDPDLDEGVIMSLNL